MTLHTARRVAIVLVAADVACTIAMLALWTVSRDPTGTDAAFVAFVLILGVTFCATGAVLIARLPANPIGWILYVVGLFQTLNALTTEYATVAMKTNPGSLPFGPFATWAASWTWMVSVFPLTTLLLLLFPDGHPPTPRWRWVGWLAIAGMAGAIGGAMAETWHLRADVDATETVQLTSPVFVVGTALLLCAVLASITSLIVRFHRSVGDERQQLRWFLYAALTLVVTLVVSFTAVPGALFVFGAAFLMVPIATAVSILKYRLYDLDIVVKKAAVALVIAVSIGAASLAILALASRVLIGVPNRVLTLVGGALLGVSVLPLVRRSRRFADRLVYGRRASAYEVMADFAERMSDTYSTDDVLARMAEILRSGTGAATATVWVRVGDALRPAATAGETDRLGDVELDGDELPAMPDGFAADVRHRGELLGVLGVTMPTNDPLDGGRARLMRDLAAQAGPVLRNVRLIEELRASRQRLVAAQDEERRKIERNIHDGVQQQLVALTVQLRLAEQLVATDPGRAQALIGQVGGQTNAALEDLRDLARGIYPPVLADKGLTAAIESQARRAALPVTVVADGVGRYSREVESAVYFCALEALNNVAKYANASAASVRLAQTNGTLRFVVGDDGVGFDTASGAHGTGLQGMADRLDAIGGELQVTSERGQGTTVVGLVPVGGEG